MLDRYILLIGIAVIWGGCKNANKSETTGSALAVAQEAWTGNSFLAALKSNLTCPWEEQTVDTFKEGRADQQITGIATTFMATQQVLQTAVDKGMNLIVTHEPTFYNHLDTRDNIGDHNVYRDKLKYILKHELMIFRFHDHWHRTDPDGIYVGMVEKLDWKAFQTSDKMIFAMPAFTLSQMATKLESLFGSSTIRVVGSPDMTLSKVGLCVGAHGADIEMGLLAKPEVELLITGESREWETVEYVRDAQIQGKKKALILMGHADSEEAGMKYCAEWLKTFMRGIPIEHIPAGNPLWSPQG